MSKRQRQRKKKKSIYRYTPTFVDKEDMREASDDFLGKRYITMQDIYRENASQDTMDA